jgi:hypothetical protein
VFGFSLRRPGHEGHPTDTPDVLAASVPHVVVDEIRQAITISDSLWAIFAGAVAAAAAAVATAILALLTRNLAKATDKMSAATKEMVSKTADLGAWTEKSVAATREIIANENANRGVDRTVALTTRYIETPVSLGNETEETPLAAASLIDAVAQNLPALRAIKSKYQPAGDSPGHKYYRRILGCFIVVNNFYESAAQTYRRRLLDEPLLMAYFARPFLNVSKAMEAVNAEVNVVTQSRLDELADFKKACQDFEQRSNAR